MDLDDGLFEGRGAELSRLREMVTNREAGSIVVINGREGVGKTALTIEYSRAFAQENPGGCWQAECQDSNAPS